MVPHKGNEDEVAIQKAFDRALRAITGQGDGEDQQHELGNEELGPRRDIGPRPVPEDEELGPRRDIGPRPVPDDEELGPRRDIGPR